MSYLLALCITLCFPAMASATDWRGTADAYASAYASNQFGPDACAGQIITVNLVPATALPVDVLGQAHIGYEKDGLSSCTMDMLETLSDFDRCVVYLHERLHLWRDDGWHDPIEGSPLYREAVPAPGSCDGAMPLVSLAETRAAVAKRLSHRWRLRLVTAVEFNGEIIEAKFKARRARKVRVYLATVSGFMISVDLKSSWRSV